MKREIKFRAFTKNGMVYLENLELWNTMQPAGQRVKDKILFAKEILKLYENTEI